MAPVEPDLSTSKLKAIAIFVGYLSLAIGLTAYIGYKSIYKAYESLPPSQATRKALSNRRRNTQIFASLAIASLAIT